MQIHFVRSGGFAGLRLAATIDSSSLPEDELQELQDELDTADFFSLPDQFTNQEGGADRFQYEITVQQGNKKHTVQSGEAALPDKLQPLVQHLDRLARTQRK